MDRALFKIYTATFLFTLMMGMGRPLVSPYLTDVFQASLFAIGIITGSYGLMQIVLRLPMGDVADALGTRRTLLGAFSFALVSGFFFIFAPSTWWLLPAMMLFGLASGIYWVSANSYLFERAEQSGVPIQTATSHYSIGLGMGLLVGPPVGGWLAANFGYPVGLSVFIWSSLLALALVASLPPSGAAKGRRGDVYRRAWRIFGNPDIRLSAFGTLTFSNLFGVLLAFYPVYVTSAEVGLGFSTFVLGILFSTREVTAMLVRFVLPGFMGRVGPRPVLLGGIVLAATGVAIIPFLATVWALAAFAVVAGIGTGVMIPANLMLVHRGAPREERGLANGIYGTALGLGSALSAFVFGGVSNAFGLPWAFWGASGVSLLGFVAMVAWLRAQGPVAASAEGSGTLKDGP